MWIFLNDSFLSIVANRDQSGVQLVRARKAGEIEALFPDAQVHKDEGTDYRFRADVPAKQVAAALTRRVKAIDYTNFKDSVSESNRHDAYFEVWEVVQKWGIRHG